MSHPELIEYFKRFGDDWQVHFIRYRTRYRHHEALKRRLEIYELTKPNKSIHQLPF